MVVPEESLHERAGRCQHSFWGLLPFLPAGAARRKSTAGNKRAEKARARPLRGVANPCFRARLWHVFIQTGGSGGKNSFPLVSSEQHISLAFLAAVKPTRVRLFHRFCRHPSIRTSGEQFLPLCKLSVLDSAGAAACYALCCSLEGARAGTLSQSPRLSGLLARSSAALARHIMQPRPRPLNWIDGAAGRLLR